MVEVWRLIGLAVGSTLIGIIYAGFLAAFGLAPRLDAAAWKFYMVWIIVVSLIGFGFGIPFMFFYFRPVVTAFHRIRAGADPKAAGLQAARRRMINLPRFIGSFVIISWMTLLFSLPVVVALSKSGPDSLSVALVLIVTVGISIVHATFAIYLMEWYVRRTFFPVFVPDGWVSDIGGLRPVTVSMKLVLLFVTSGLYPIVAYTALIATGTPGLAAAIFIGVASFIIGVAQSLLILSSVARPIDRLHREMSKVGRGNFNAIADVDTADRLGQLNEGFNRMVAGLEKGRFVEEAFGKYVARPVMDEILGGRVSLGGERRVATVLFADLRDFTAMCERMAPEHVVLILNRYLDTMVDSLVAHGATIDKFIGDAIVAVFNVPVTQEDHAERAVRAAVDMIDRLTVLNRERVRAGDKLLEMGIGIHTGDVVAGNVGSAKKMEYTVIGDTVNTAARVEKLNKSFGSRILVTESTYQGVVGKVRELDIGPVDLEGKRFPVAVFEVAGMLSRESEVPTSKIDLEDQRDEASKTLRALRNRGSSE